MGRRHARQAMGGVFAALTLAAACGGDPDDGEASPSPSVSSSGSAPTVSPTPTTPPGDLPPLALELYMLLVDPDPETASDFDGALDVARLTELEILPDIDVVCLENNGMRVGYILNDPGPPGRATWGFELSTAQGAVNCADQMRRTDVGNGTVTDLTGRYGLENVTAYAISRPTSDGQPDISLRALFTADNLLFRVSVFEPGKGIGVLEPAFEQLLQQQVVKVRSGR